MKITFTAPDEWQERLDELAKCDGHSNRGAIVRKILKIFFDQNLQFSSVSMITQKNLTVRHEQNNDTH